MITMHEQSAGLIICQKLAKLMSIKTLTGTRGGNRTRTTFKGHRILSPACLPVPPPEQVRNLFKLKSLPAGKGFGAKDEIRTRDPNLGKVVLYQLSYFRITTFFVLSDANIGRKLFLSRKFEYFFLLF